MPDDTERLVILLEAKINDLEKNMAKASGTTARAYREMSTGSRRATSQMQDDAIRSTLRINQALDATRAKVGVFSSSFASGLIAPLAGLLSLSVAINGTKAAIEKFSDINDKAASSGLDAEYFQGVVYQAKLAGIEIGEMSGALSTFHKLSGQAVEGRGKLVTQLKGEHAELLKGIQAATTQEQRFRLVVQAIADAKNETEGAVIAAAAFGDQGVRIAAAFRDGASALDETMRKAKELGLIVDRDVIARADQLGDEFDTVSQVIDLKVKTAMIDLGPVMVDLVGWAADMARNLAIVSDQFRDIESRRFVNPLQNALAEIENSRSTLMMEIAGLETQLKDIDPASGWAGTLTAEIEAKAARAEELMQKALEYQERVAQLQGKAAGPQAPPPKPAGGAFTPGNWGSSAFTSAAPQAFDRALLDAPKLATSLGRVSSAAYESTVAIGSTADAVDALRTRAEEMADAVETSIGGAFASLFDGPITDVQQGLEGILGSFAQLGQQNLSSIFSGMLTPANQNTATGGTMGSGLWGSAIFEGAKAGTMAGAEKGIPSAFGDLLKSIPGGAGTVGAAAGGLGLGYQTQSPLMGALGGAMSGAAAGPWGAVAGGIAGFIGGLLGMNEALEKSRKAVKDNRTSIDQFIATGLGQEVDSISVAVAQFKAQGAQLVELAKAAGDTALVRRLERAMAAYRDTLKAQERIDKLTNQVETDRDQLREAYERESSALRDVIDRNKAFIESIQQFKDSLLLNSSLSPLSPQDRLIEAQMQFQQVSQAAIGGDANAQAQLQQAAQAYLEQARNMYASSEGYVAIFAQVQSVLDQAIAAGNGAVANADRQLNKLTDLVGGQIDLKNTVVSVAKAVAKLNSDMAKLQAAQIAAAQDTTASVKSLTREIAQSTSKRAA